MMQELFTESINNISVNAISCSESTLALLLQYLNSNQIDYLLLEPHDQHNKNSKSIDLVISKPHLNKITYYMHHFCDTNNLLIVRKNSFWNMASFFILSDEEDRLIPIKVNFNGDYQNHWHSYFSSKELLKNKSFITETNNWGLDYVYSFVFYLIKSIEENNTSKSQFSQLLRCWKCANKSIIKQLKRFFKEESLNIIAKSFNNNDIEYLIANLDNLEKDLQAISRMRIIDIIFGKVLLLKSAFKPSGLVVGLLGRDGTGKSSLMNELSDSLKYCFDDTAFFNKFPKLFYNGNAFNKKNKDNTRPHLYKERSYFVSFIKLNMLFIEFLLGYWLKVFPFKRRSHLVLYDRYFIDVLADPLRYRIKGNKFFIKAFHNLLPKPDLWIVLDLPSETLLQRKQELTYEMSEKLRQEYLTLPGMLTNCIVIDNDEPLKITSKKALSFILDYLHKRAF